MMMNDFILQLIEIQLIAVFFSKLLLIFYDKNG